MRICITVDGVRHCFTLPYVTFPLHFHPPGPRPVNYPPFITDAIILSSIYEAAEHVGDEKVRSELRRGVEGALEALRGLVGDYAEIEFTEKTMA